MNTKNSNQKEIVEFIETCEEGDTIDYTPNEIIESLNKLDESSHIDRHELFNSTVNNDGLEHILIWIPTDNGNNWVRGDYGHKDIEQTGFRVKEVGEYVDATIIEHTYEFPLLKENTTEELYNNAVWEIIEDVNQYGGFIEEILIENDKEKFTMNDTEIKIQPYFLETFIDIRYLDDVREALDDADLQKEAILTELPDYLLRFEYELKDFN